MSSLNLWLKALESTPHYLDMPAPRRIKIMLTRLKLKKDFFIITIAGTNGKGTTTHLLSNYFQQQGLTVGRFSSPHLLSFNERIAVNNINATDAEIIKAFTQIKSVQAELPLTYFDYSFLASLIIFKDHQVNLVCLEVGLGGRLDATNAFDTDCAIITTIDLDHQAQLGNSRDAIGFEKAHIMRANIPCVCGDLDPPASIKDYANTINAQLYLRNRDFSLIDNGHSWQLKTKNAMSEPLPYPKHIPTQNAITALMSISLINPKLNLSLNIKAFKDLLLNLQVPGRMQILQEQPKILLDVAHNPESARYLAQQLLHQKVKGQTHALFAALNDKDLAAIIKPMAAIIDTWHILKLSHPRASSLEQLKATILTVDSKATIESLNALKDFEPQLNAQDQLIIFGSFILAQEALGCLSTQSS